MPTTGLADFKSDRCSMFPDGSYYSCCYLHDVAYWPGGTAEARELADKSLRDCVSGITHNEASAEAMYNGVRVGGVPGLRTPYRWGGETDLPRPVKRHDGNRRPPYSVS